MMGFIGLLGCLATAKAGAERMKRNALERYKRALKLPRKKKKQEKKRALIDMSFAQCINRHFTF
jgi:hypothetical protein